MVMAGAVKVEKELNTQLPGNAETSGADGDWWMRWSSTIAEHGEVTLNDEPMDTPDEQGDARSSRTRSRG